MAMLSAMAQDSEAVVIDLSMMDLPGCDPLPAATAPAMQQNCPPAPKPVPPPRAVVAQSAPLEAIKPLPEVTDSQAQTQASPVAVAASESSDHPDDVAELVQPSAYQSATKASSGSGTAQKNGNGQEQGSSSDTAGNEQLLKLYNKNHFAYIQQIIGRKIRYPRAARVAGQEGTVLVAFIVSKDGSIAHLQVEKGSGHSLLDENALDAVRSAAPFPRPPTVAQLRVPVSYNLSKR